MKKNSIIELKNITVKFDGETVLDDLSLSIGNGEFVTFLGASGCGKTTTLRIIAGFLEPDEGEVFFDSKNMNGVPAYKREVNTIFQRYALLPNYNVFENIAFGLRVKKVKENGYESLKLQKKGPKPKYLVEPQTNEELLQLEIERLRREKERLELEVEVLKKKHRLQKRANIRK